MDGQMDRQVDRLAADPEVRNGTPKRSKGRLFAVKVDPVANFAQFQSQSSNEDEIWEWQWLNEKRLDPKKWTGFIY